MTLIFTLLIGGAVVLAAVIGGRAIVSIAWRDTLTAFRLQLPAKLTVDDVARWLGMIAAATHAPQWSLFPMPPLCLEIMATADGIEYYALTAPDTRAKFLGTLRAGLPGVRIEKAPDYVHTSPRFLAAGEFTTTTRHRPLSSERADATTAAFLASLQPLHGTEEIRLQLILTSAGTPQPVHSASPHPQDRWWATYLVEGVPPADAEAVSALPRKQADPLLHVAMRLGVQAESKARAWDLLGRTWPTLHGENAPGVRVVGRWLSSPVVAGRMAKRAMPTLLWPLLLGTRELAGFTGLLAGASGHLPGLKLGIARQLPPTQAIPHRGTVLAVSNYQGTSRPLAISQMDRTRSVHVLGPVGVGKSALLANMVLQDAEAGAGIVVIDPKNDLVTDLLARLPEKRHDDVIVLDPAAADRPIGINLLGGLHSEADRELAVDHVVHIMASIWRDSWGPRTSDVLRSALLTLTHTTAPDGSTFTLVEVPELLTNPSFRRYVTGQRGIPDVVRPFWHTYEQMSDGERANVIGPSLNKLRALTTRSALRLLLGQSSGVDIADVFRKRRILLVRLSKGLVGSETASLLGSLIMALVYRAVLARVAVPAEHRRPVFVHLDEFQDVLRLPVDIVDIIAQFRGQGGGLTLSHQFLDQLPASVKAALGTVRSSVVFQLDYDDAQVMAKRLAPLTAEDLMNLPQFEAVLRLSAGGQTQRPMTGTTLPPPEPIADGNALAAASRERYGQPRSDVEQAIKARITAAAVGGKAGIFGRRRRGGDA